MNKAEAASACRSLVAEKINKQVQHGLSSWLGKLRTRRSLALIQPVLDAGYDT